MKQILGLDLGTNSIGWALINENNSLEGMGAVIFPKRNNDPTINHERNQLRLSRKLQQRQLIRQLSYGSLLRKQTKLNELILTILKLNIDIKRLLCFCLTLLMFTFAVILKSQWQFWLNLGIGGVFILLNVETKKGK